MSDVLTPLNDPMMDADITRILCMACNEITGYRCCVCRRPVCIDHSIAHQYDVYDEQMERVCFMCMKRLEEDEYKGWPCKEMAKAKGHACEAIVLAKA